ncbi:MAG: SemiSWEET transporter [Saprospiraceae bacterium]|jgi:MtN3 and saliva related transmembrane protein
MDYITTIGITAALLTTSAFLPQVIKTWKTRSTGDLSFPMYLMMVTGIFLWLIYGLFRKDWPIILANGVSFCLTLVILVFKIKENMLAKKAGK